WYSGVVEPTLEISPYVGNWYTGSVHVARYSALQDAKTERNVGSKMLVGSYGSGAQAEVHGEIIGEGVDRLPELDMERVTDERYDLDWEEYKKLHDHHERENKTEISESFVEPENEFVFVGYGEMGEREYEYV
ncbi:MAG: hydroxymethylglutaryl-CoA synthase, partial [Candidatus Aenigmatarchaeota archaeon]